MTRFPHLLSPMALGGCSLRNRIVSTGHDTAMAHDGLVSDQLVAYQEARAKGGAGLIIIQVSGVHETARYTSHMLMATSDDAIAGYRRLADAVQRHGTRIFGQLFHPGREIMETDDGTQPVAYAPSAVPNSRFHVMPVPMSHALIEEIIEGYGDAARRMDAAGFDGCEIVASHGYLPAQFLNPNLNLRSDQWGGSDENRLRFLKAVLAGVREKTRPGFVVGLRISAHEKDSLSPEQSLLHRYCAMLESDGGPDYYSVVAGTSSSLQGAVHIAPPMPYESGYTAPYAHALKKVVSKPVIVTGRVNEPAIGEQIIASGSADLVGMTRAMICDPLMPEKVAQGRNEDIRACIGCDQACIGHFHKGYPISCIQHPETGRELRYGTLTPATKPKRILVVGGGPAGMKAAVTLARRGHQVSLHEATGQLGGQALLAQLLPGRAEFGGIVTNLARELVLADVPVNLNSRVTPELVSKERPDSVVVATGALPYRPPVEIAEASHVVDAWQVLRGQARIGKSVVVADWRSDWIGIGISEKLAREGRRVRLCIDGVMAGEALPFYVRDTLLAELYRLGVEITPHARLFGADGDTAYFENSLSGEPLILEDVDTLVVSHGHTPVNDLVSALAATYPGEVHTVGDALAARTAEEAVFDGLRIGAAL